VNSEHLEKVLDQDTRPLAKQSSKRTQVTILLKSRPRIRVCGLALKSRSGQTSTEVLDQHSRPPAQQSKEVKTKEQSLWTYTEEPARASFNRGLRTSLPAQQSFKRTQRMSRPKSKVCGLTLKSRPRQASTEAEHMPIQSVYRRRVILNTCMDWKLKRRPEQTSTATIRA
jgi:hypothetical protein